MGRRRAPPVHQVGLPARRRVGRRNPVSRPIARGAGRLVRVRVDRPAARAPRRSVVAGLQEALRHRPAALHTLAGGRFRSRYSSGSTERSPYRTSDNESWAREYPDSAVAVESLGMRPSRARTRSSDGRAFTTIPHAAGLRTGRDRHSSGGSAMGDTRTEGPLRPFRVLRRRRLSKRPTEFLGGATPLCLHAQTQLSHCGPLVTPFGINE